MKYAIEYGADAVYAGVPDFSLRVRINAFTFETLKKGVKYAHKKDKKFYVTLNIYAHNQHFDKLEKHLRELQKIDIDGIVLSDPGMLDLVKEYLPKVEIHLSTQANATNWRAVKFWAEQGVKRVVLAREVTLGEIKEIHQRVPEVELEYFVHGAMCMSYSGRCILSKWMTGRSANLGDCSQPCRWAWKTVSNEQRTKKTVNSKQMTVVDHQGEFEMELQEDDNGTYFFNSKDLNLLAHLKDLIDAGVTSFKIEGRNKSVYYLATVVRAYKRIMDYKLGIMNDESDKDLIGGYEKVLKQEQKNLNDLVHRGYTTGFLLGKEPEHNFVNSHNESEYEFVGEVLEDAKKTRVIPESRFSFRQRRIGNYLSACPPSAENSEIKNSGQNLIKIKAHNAIYADDKIEIISPDGNYPLEVLAIYNEKMEKVESAHGGHKGLYYLKIKGNKAKPFSLLRKRIS